MKILLLGSGGREHALAWKIAKSPHCEQLFIAPGNGGTSEIATQIALKSVNDFEAIANILKEKQIDLLVVGPEEPLVRGLVDYLRKADGLEKLLIVGPDAAGAKLEGSKVFSKDFMLRNGIPTAKHLSVRADNLKEGLDFLDSLKPPYVLKADGLAAGKGVLILKDLNEAKKELEAMLDGMFGVASDTVIIEEFLHGVECSVFIACDGKNYRILPVAKDYKRIGDGDTGPNTGGMGAVSPVPFVDDNFMQKVESQIVKPTIAGLIAEQIDYRGFIFAGLMSVDGNPYVIEYNCRMGDPETEAVMLRIDSDFVELLVAMAKGKLAEYQLVEDTRHVCSLVLVSQGYPGSYKKGATIEVPLPPEDTIIFHAGTILEEGKLLSNGGRVLVVSSYGSTAEAAKARAYQHAKQVLFEGKNYRHDIGDDMISLSKTI